ncbi:MAG: InlB B-repeat-containing protein [Clostridia bacterium]|nr:InlB B-repeat-containing protein [Clostridia bacterium]
MAKGLLTNVYSSCNFERVVGEIYNEATKWGVHRYYWDHVDVKCGDYYPVYFPLSSSDSLSAIERSVYQGKYDKNFNKDLADLCAKHGCMPSEAPYYVRLAAEESASLKTKSELRTEEAEAVKAARDYLGTNIASSYDSEIFTLVDDTYGVKVELHSNVCEMNTNFITECFNKIIDPEKKTKNVKFVDTDGNVVDAVLVGYYGFYTYHENEKDTDITVKALFYVEGKLMSDDVVLTVKANALVNWGIIGFTDTAFEKGSSVEECLDIIFEHGFTLFYEYSNGQRREFFVNSENRNAVDIYNLNTFEYGEKTVTVYHNEQPVVGKLIKFEQTVTFACNHSADDFVKVGTVPATCRLLGYEIWKCQKGGEGCGKEIHKNYFSGDHTYVVIGGQHATCHEPGYTQQVHCSVCNKVFESSEWIQALPHAYVSGNSAEYVSNASYPASDYHYCTSGNHYEAHQYTVREQIDDNGTLVYVYTCFCGYEHPIRDTNIKTDESGKMPTVIVTNGYVLEVGDEVVVYVQILNNPGFKGATFGIRYTDGLELLSAEESSIVPQQLKVKNEVYCGYNFLWAMGDGNRTTADGYLLKLTFRYVDTAEREQGIAVVYGMSNGSSGGFCTLDGEYSMFKTESGTVTVVDHLPGDVNSDNRVDVMDATHIAWSIVGHLDANGNRFTVNPKYADVNLDGNIDLVDVLLILQSISGRYGTSLLNSEYKLIFDLNGFVSNDVDESVTVQFYDESGNRTKWSENLDFAMYEAFMQRLGYNFVGWYTRMDCTCASDCTHRVADSELVSYDKYQSAQTLYARWEKNKVSFEMNGATSGAIGDVFYDPSSSTVKFSTPSLSYAIDYHVTGYEGIYKTLPIYKNFEGWYIESTDISVSELDLATPNLGTVKVVARWSDYVWNKPSEERAGYSDVTSWYYKNQYADEFKVSVMDDAAIENLISLGSNLYGRENPIEYTITYGNAYGLDYINDSKCFVTDTVILKSLPDRTGYKFAGWIDENGNPVTVISSTTQNRVITAKWKAKVYTITVKGIEETKYTADTGAVDLNRKGNPVYDEGLLTNTKFTLYFTYGDDGVPGFYTTYDNGVLSGALNGKALENMMNNAGLYENFVFGGFYYGGTITDNGHSYASTGTNTAIVSADGSLIYDFAKDTVSKFNESTETGTLYALIIPKQYTINFALNAPAYGVTGSTGYTTSVKAYHNESLATVNIVMPSNTYYRSTYVYNGFEYYGFDGKSTALANFPQHDKDYAVTLTAYWGTDRAINDTTYHASAYSYIYYVKNANDLNQVRNYPSASYMLLTNVTLSGEWTPIPNFSGSFNGNYKYIKGLSICKYSPATVNSETNFGLFANITSTAQIYNLDIYDASIYFDPQHGGSGWINAGFIAGTGNGTITNVRVYNSNLTIHRNQSRYGGIIGNCTGGTISNCTVFGINLNGNGDSGGIVGRLAGTVSGCKVTKSSSQNTTIRHYATESARSIGGICGYSEYGNTVSCHVSNTSFILDGDASLCPWFGKIVGHQQGGCIHYVGQEESTIYIKSEVALYTTNIFGGIKNDYRGHWFAVGWGFTGEASGEVSVK